MLALCLANLSFATLIGGYARTGAGSLPLLLWRWAKLGQGLGHLCGWFASVTSTPMLGLLAIALLMSGALLDLAAYLRFLDAGSVNRVLSPLAVIGLLSYLAALSFGASKYQRIGVAGIYLAVLALVMAYALLRTRPVSLLQRLIASVDLLFALTLFIRVGVVLGGGAPSWLAGSQMLVFLSAFVLVIVNGFGFVLLSKAKADAALARLASVDPLTGLANRRAFLEQANSTFHLSDRTGLPLSLLMIDLDLFKRINDRYGHQAGDMALQTFARAAMACQREQDLLGRLGGEEFALLLPGTDLNGALQAAERVRQAVQEAPLAFQGETYRLTVSIGVAAVEAGESLEAAIARADAGMYEAKSAGRNCVCVGQRKSA